MFWLSVLSHIVNVLTVIQFVLSFLPKRKAKRNSERKQYA